MKLKRVLLIIIAGIKTLLILYIIGRLAMMARATHLHSDSYYLEMMSYVDGIVGDVRDICLLALVDFFFCIGQKSYGKSMLGIAIAMFVFPITLTLAQFVLLAYNLPTFFDVILIDVYTGMAYYYLWTVLKTLPFVGLAVAYIVSKHNYLKKARINDAVV